MDDNLTRGTSCIFNEGVQCQEQDIRCDTCGWNPAVQEERREGINRMRFDLCEVCAGKMREGYTLKIIKRETGNKPICSNCGRRRYTVAYELIKKKNN